MSFSIGEQVCILRAIRETYVPGMDSDTIISNLDKVVKNLMEQSDHHGVGPKFQRDLRSVTADSLQDLLANVFDISVLSRKNEEQTKEATLGLTESASMLMKTDRPRKGGRFIKVSQPIPATNTPTTPTITNTAAAATTATIRPKRSAEFVAETEGFPNSEPTTVTTSSSPAKRPKRATSRR